MTERDMIAILGQVKGPDPKPPKRKKKKKPLLPEPFPDYGKSIVTQGKGDPRTAGILRGAGTGALGAVLGALGARALDADAKDTALAAVLAGLLTGAVGYKSGKRERESENTRLLALRRLGIETPGEQEFSEEFPLLSTRVTTKGVRV
jgi:hypothetical protein